jgi:chromosome segregation ATPase
MNDDRTRLDSGQLHTLAEASRLTGLSVDALRQRAKRGKLDTVRGNDGLVLVRLTTADRDAIRLATDRPSSPTTTSQTDQKDQTIKALEAQATSLNEALARERLRVDAADARAELAERERSEARERAARAEGEAIGLRATLDAERQAARRERERADNAERRETEAQTLAERLGEQIIKARDQVAEAEGEARALRNILAETKRPAWRRWLRLS